MSFGEELQGKSSHDALVALQEAEIRLLENIKKCLTSRIKLDRDYAAGLADIAATAHKFDAAEFKSPLFQAWSLICKEAEVQQKLIHDNADRLCMSMLEHLCRLINDKKATRRFYIDERQRLEVDFLKIQEESQKHKAEYEKVLEKCLHEKAKYEDTQAKGKPLVKIEEAKNRYCKSAGKLHRVHNDYVMTLRELNNHQRNYLTTTLPGLLNFQQNVQQAMVEQSKNILSGYVASTDFTSETFVKCQRQMRQCVTDVDPQTEYNVYIEKHKSDRLESTKFEFDQKLLEDYKGTLRLNEIALDELTVENLRNCRATFQERLTSCQRKRETKEKELETLQNSLSQKPPYKDMDDADRKSYEAEGHAVEVLKKDIAELKCSEEKNSGLYNLLNDPLTRLGEAAPPQAIVFTETPADPAEHRTSVAAEDPGPSYPTTGSTGTFSRRLQNLRLKIPFRKGPSTPPPKLPSKDTLDQCPPDDMEKYQNEEDEGDEMESPAAKVKPVNSVASGEVGDRPNSNVRRTDSAASDSYQQPNRKLEDEEWFHGVLPREEVQRLLVQDGDYLVRESKNKKTGQPQHVLSVMWSGHKHFIIQGQEGSWRFEGQQYKTIQELVIQQHRSNLPVTNKSQAILCAPVVREDWELKNDDIELGENIGHGNFGEVYRGIYKKAKQDVAVKTCRETLSDDAKKKFLQEGRILKQYNHPNIVRFIGIAAQRNPVMIVMEYVPGGSLLQFLRTQGSLQTTKQLIKMCEDAAAGMAYLEGRGCIHRDLAARNCLVGKNHVVKISDFGMSREEEEYTVSGGPKQIPIKWTAPEALHFGKYTTMCDIWSYGILMWEIFSFGDPPYNGLTNKQAREKIDTGYRMPAPEHTPEEVYVLMLRCWDVLPENRPHFEEIHKELCNIRTKV